MLEPRLLIGKQYQSELCALFARASASISIVMFAWETPTSGEYKKIFQLNDTLCSARKRGVSVRAIVHFHKTLDFLRHQNINAKKIHIGGLLHTKMVIIDERIVLIGSHNFTERAFTTNAEASVIIENERSENAFTRHFHLLWQTTN